MKSGVTWFILSPSALIPKRSHAKIKKDRFIPRAASWLFHTGCDRDPGLPDS